eukprot:5474712-Prymnesium_polylepis.2
MHDARKPKAAVPIRRTGSRHVKMFMTFAPWSLSLVARLRTLASCKSCPSTAARADVGTCVREDG